MYFLIRRKDVHQPEIVVKGDKLVSDFKYLWIIIDSHLTFEKQVKRPIRTVKLNRSIFKFIGNQLTTDAWTL